MAIRATLFRRGQIDGVLVFDMEAIDEYVEPVFQQLLHHFERRLMDALQPILDKVTALESAMGTLKTDNATLVALAQAQGAQLAAIAAGQVVDPAELATIALRLDAVLQTVTAVDTSDTGAVVPPSTGTVSGTVSTGSTDPTAAAAGTVTA